MKLQVNSWPTNKVVLVEILQVQTFCPNYQWCTMDSLNPPHSFRAIGSLQFHRITTQGLDPSPFEICQRKLFYRFWILICLPKCISFMSLISILAWIIWFPTKQKRFNPCRLILWVSPWIWQTKALWVEPPVVPWVKHVEASSDGGGEPWSWRHWRNGKKWRWLPRPW